MVNRTGRILRQVDRYRDKGKRGRNQERFVRAGRFTWHTGRQSGKNHRRDSAPPRGIGDGRKVNSSTVPRVPQKERRGDSHEPFDLSHS
jgi:hypothetical protein